jgi:Ca2+-binding RTX toxin-like protein
VAEYAELLVNKDVKGTNPVTADDTGGTLTGDTANNTFISNTGRDTLIGKEGNDTYRFNNGFNTDTINELSGNDILDFTKVAANLTITVDALDSSGNLKKVVIVAPRTGSNTNQVTLNAEAANGVLTIKSGTNTDDTLDLSAVTVDLKVTIKSKQIVVSLDTTPATQLLIVEGVENLKFGNANDTVIFEKGAKLAGKLEGGSGTNTLDYGGETLNWFGNFYTTQLQVNLTS